MCDLAIERQFYTQLLLFGYDEDCKNAVIWNVHVFNLLLGDEGLAETGDRLR